MSRYNSNSRSNNSGLKLDAVLTIIFVVLKLVGVIDWSWIWVLSPTWISLILYIIAKIGINVYYRLIISRKKYRGSDRIKW